MTNSGGPQARPVNAQVTRDDLKSASFSVTVGFGGAATIGATAEVELERASVMDQVKPELTGVQDV